MIDTVLTVLHIIAVIIVGIYIATVMIKTGKRLKGDGNE